MDFFATYRRLEDIAGLKYGEQIITREQLDDAEDAMELTFGAELELYLLKFNGLAKRSVKFFDLDELIQATTMYRAIIGSDFKYFAIEHATVDTLAVVNQKDEVFLYHQSSGVTENTGMDLFAYILSRLEPIPET